ncbi:3'-5' exonuclease [Streptomyces sp. NPDC006422]|uniref:3'-5' exonuclease n=1 Tax=unclassified Streptomyces TaxID=2593676 RepID=UPI0033B997EB
MSWHEGLLAGFDLETTGIDVDQDRIVTACVVQCGRGHDTTSSLWLADPGIDIPETATAMHGITTEHARTEGQPARQVVTEVVAALADAVLAGVPVVAMNAPFDLTILDREARRHGVTPLVDIVGNRLHVLDPRVIDKQVDRYRRGGRTLADLAAHYRVPLEGAHTADADALAACRVVWRMSEAFPDMRACSLDELHALQVQWAREQAEGLAAYFRRTPGKEHQADGVTGTWPYVPAARTGGEG